MADIINLVPIEEQQPIPELLRKLADDIETGRLPNAKGCTIAVQSEIDEGTYAFEIFGWGGCVQTRADVYWSLMKAGAFVL